MKSINWNTMSDLGLMRRINEQVLHPLGLAMSRNPTTGASECVFIAPDGVFKYGSKDTNAKTDEEIKEFIASIK